MSTRDLSGPASIIRTSASRRRRSRGADDHVQAMRDRPPQVLDHGGDVGSPRRRRCRAARQARSLVDLGLNSASGALSMPATVRPILPRAPSTPTLISCPPCLVCRPQDSTPPAPRAGNAERPPYALLDQDLAPAVRRSRDRRRHAGRGPARRRKISGFRTPAAKNAAAFDQAVDESPRRPPPPRRPGDTRACQTQSIMGSDRA